MLQTRRSSLVTSLGEDIVAASSFSDVVYSGSLVKLGTDVNVVVSSLAWRRDDTVGQYNRLGQKWGNTMSMSTLE